ncbi:MAG: dihydrolipoamide acetyltransferase family protein [Actinomycetota bacterium]
MAERSFKVPDLGEGLTEAEIVNWLVKVGDSVELNQPIVEVETEKAIVEVPSPFEGKIKELKGEVGEKVEVGSVFVIFEVEDSDDDDSPTEAGSRKEVLVGYGPEEGGGKRRKQRKIGRRKGSGDSGESGDSSDSSDAAGSSTTTAKQETKEAPAPAKKRAHSSNGSAKALATPPVRKMARELGVDIDSLTGSGPDGRVTREDVEAAAKAPASDAASAPAAASASSAPAGSTAARRRVADGPEEERIPVRAIRRSIAEKMVRAKHTIPHVTEWLEVDATELMAVRAQLKSAPEAKDIKISPLAIIAKAFTAALRSYPLINASWDDDRTEIVIHHPVHLGIATDTDRGLLVPVIKDADQLSILEISQETSRLAELSRSGKIGPADLTGSTVTITNIGSFGMQSGTPIINHPEAAILAPGAIVSKPWVVDGKIEVRQIMTLALAFDHRMIDGAYAGRFLRHLGDLIESPARLLAAL